MTERTIKHNPAFLTDEELLNSFVVRQAELEILLQITRENTGNVNQQAIVIGSRGMGKTMLMRRLAVAVQNDSKLNRLWLPVMIPEETYNVASEGELWLRVLQYVARGYQDDRLKKVFDHLQTEPDEFRLKSQAVARLKEWAEAKKKRLIIMIENFNMILEEQATDYSDWDLRKTLLNEPDFMVVATATARFDEIENAQKSMFELFREIRLNPLSTKECALLWKQVTGQDIKEQKIRPMEILTGGNPRLLAILASFSADTPFGDLMRDLIILIDDHTSYFKANVESLPPLERRIFITLAEIWEPAMARDIAKRARLDVNKTSSLLKRLTQRGAVTIVKQEGRRFYYQVAERLYNIYHLMRQSSDASERACAVVEFMVRFYDPDRVACAIARDACLFLPRKSDLHDRAYKYLLSKYSHEEMAIGRNLSSTPKQFLYQYEVYAEEFANIGKEMERMMESIPFDLTLPDKMKSATELKKLLKSDNINKLIKTDPRKVIEALNKMIDTSDFNEVELDLSIIAECYMLKANIYYLNNELDKVRLTLDELISRFGDHDDPGILERVASALVNKGVALRRLGKAEEEVVAYDEVVTRFGDHGNPEVLTQVARALFNKGVALGRLGKAEEEIAAYDEVVTRFGDHDNPEILAQVAGAKNGKAWTIYCLNNKERFPEALSLVKSAQESDPENSSISHTIAMISGALNQWDQAFQFARIFLSDDSLIEYQTPDIIDFFKLAASRGMANDALKLLKDFPALSAKLEPLVVALKIKTQKEFSAPQEVVEVAMDILKQIEEHEKDHENRA
jgi:tetratricopeptide (TPR) repeat protein/predicted transcriptional regulator